MRQIAIWNDSTDEWLNPSGAIDLFSEHSEPFSERWPDSGTTRNGAAFERPTWELPTDANGCSSSRSIDGSQASTISELFRTPAAAEADGGRREPNRPTATMRLSDQVAEEQERGVLLPTPPAHDLFPTPSASLHNDGEDPERWQTRADRLREKHGNGNGAGTPLPVAVARLTDDGVLVNWGKYAAATAAAESASGRPAPMPTALDGAGKPRLSPRFVEWMMLLPDQWVTEPSLWVTWTPSAARRAQLRMLGNGVVPRQAAVATEHLLARVRARLAER